MAKTKKSPKVKRKSRGILTGVTGTGALGLGSATAYSAGGEIQRIFRRGNLDITSSPHPEVLLKDTKAIKLASNRALLGYGAAAAGAGLLYKSYRSRKALKKGKKRTSSLRDIVLPLTSKDPKVRATAEFRRDNDIFRGGPFLGEHRWGKKGKDYRKRMAKYVNSKTRGKN